MTFLLSFSALLAVTLAVFTLMDNTQPEPYMDEVFHVPQAQRYCQGKFTEWDPKITTLPGLYFISIGMLSPISQVAKYMNRANFSSQVSQGSVEDYLCTTQVLRLLNVVLLMLNAIILHKLSFQVHGGKYYFDEKKVFLSAFNMSIFPVLYFFSFFYYTDVGSTSLVLLMYCLHLEGKDWLASFIGLLSVAFRQTNIVWVAFVAIQAVGPILIHTIHIKMLEKSQPVKFSLTTSGQIWELVEGTYFLLFEPRRLLSFVGDCLWKAGGYVLVWLAFVTFVSWNEGIVVGDRSAHVAVFHPTQVLYFCLFSLGFSASFCATKIKVFLHYSRRHYCVLLAVLAVAYVFVEGYTMAHAYLLADNRHYTFYVWRRFINRNDFSKYLFIPFYVFGGFCIFHSIRKTNVIFKIFFPLLVFVNLCPQLLLEFRYFILPYLLYRLQIRPQTWWKLVLETVIYVFVNCVTFFLFVKKPFRWQHEPDDIQRFIW